MQKEYSYHITITTKFYHEIDYGTDRQLAEEAYNKLLQLIDRQILAGITVELVAVCLN